MACDVVAVRLHLPQVRMPVVLADSPGELVVEVELTVRRLRCAHRGFKCHWVHDGRANKVRDLQVSGRPVRPVWQRRRMVCADCDSRLLEDRPALEGALNARVARRPVAAAGRLASSSMSRLQADAEQLGIGMQTGHRHRYPPACHGIQGPSVVTRRGLYDGSPRLLGLIDVEVGVFSHHGVRRYWRLVRLLLTLA